MTMSKNNNGNADKFIKIFEEISNYLAESNPQKAYNTIRTILDYPGQISNDDIWKDSFLLFEKILVALGRSDLSNNVKMVVKYPDDINALYDLAYQLYEVGANGIAATLLKRAQEFSPHDENIVSELASNLEALMLFREAKKILSKSQLLLDNSELCRYLLGFNSLMAGDLLEPARIVPTLEKSTSENIQFMAKSLQAMLNRASCIKNVTPLDKKDLRGWHMVINGSILLHLSPFGFENAMHGRYAYISDSYSLCKEGITRVKKVLDHLKIDIPCILSLPDRSSQILSIAISKIFEKPLKNLIDVDITTKGLLVAYDLDRIKSEDTIIQISEHRPGQILWAHATCWTNPFPFVADITTFLYQENMVSWIDGSISVDIEKKKTKKTEPDNAPNEEIAQRIIDAEINQEYFKDLDTLLKLVEPLSTLKDYDKPGIYKDEGRRIRLRKGSPVPSNVFI